ncbi:MAG: aspartate aminotransferase family protein [Mycoplasmatales bacterium]
MSKYKQEILEKRTEYLIGCSHLFFQEPLMLVEGKMQYVWDDDGKKYVDMLGGFSVLACGHANPAINQAIVTQLEKIVHTTQVFVNEKNVLLAEKMAELLPADLSKSFFLNSGSEANEMAMMLAAKHTNKKGVIHLEYSLHGRTNNALAVTGMKMWHPYSDFGQSTYEAVSFYPTDHVSFEAQAERSLASVEEILKTNDDIGCMIIEVIQGNGGVLLADKTYYKRLKTLLEQYNVLLIVDEAQTAYGRLGSMFGFMNFDFVPDILVTCKALGNGIALSSVTTTPKISASFTTPSASTLGGNHLACATALAVIKYIEEENLAQKASELGTYLKDELTKIQVTNSHVTSVRGKGLMLGIEFSSSEICDEVLEYLLLNGFICGKSGLMRNVILLEPPLVVEKTDLQKFITTFATAVQSLNNG